MSDTLRPFDTPTGSSLPAELPIPGDRLSAGLVALLAHSGAGLSIKDLAGRYVWANAVMAGMMDCALESMAGASDADLLGLAHGAELRAADQRALHAGGVATGEHQFERADGRRIYRTLRLALPPGPGGEAAQILSAWWDDSDVREQASHLQQALAQIERQQAAFEKLLARQNEGLDHAMEHFRSDTFEEHLRRELALSSREHREFALGLLALDGVAQCRAAQGEAGVERIMAAIGQILRTNTRSMDMICRLSEDRFGVLLSGVGLATAHTRLEQFRRQCATHIVVSDGQSIKFSVSEGVASFPHTADALETLYQAAEAALTNARGRGGNRVSLAAIPLLGPSRAAVAGEAAAPARMGAVQPTALVSM